MRELNEKCAVVGVFGVDKAALIAHLGLYAMQHRGQEATGISAANGARIATIKDRGLVSRVYTDESLSKLPGCAAIGHNRYSTAGEDSILDAQPIFARYALGEIAIAHNGNFPNARAVRAKLIEDGAIFNTSLDTENLVHLIAKSHENKLQERILDTLSQCDGSYSLLFLSRTKLFAARDPRGFRPLSLAKLGDGYMIASETCAFDLAGAKFIRDIEPGEMVIFEEGKEPRSVNFAKEPIRKCIFEHIYFARPDSFLFGESVYAIRKELGRLLWEECKTNADMVIPVPDSSIPHAIGYAQASGLPFELGIIRNHYVGRTFIEPLQEIRDLKVKKKLSPVKELICGKRLVIVDDSIVRGTTSRQIVSLLREAGAKEIHMRIASPTITHCCFYGIDTPQQSELISHKMSVDQIREYLKADSLRFLSIDALRKAARCKGDFCLSCFDGEYYHDPANNSVSNAA
ncbi:MAG: amidophosphoribosyltransferase [Helicobacteraceae bacterium]|jgi:amidophosphoribosyltransferase|nr:amidophosphoribosyltransferase [Helicobacteraceae bacterium]